MPKKERKPPELRPVDEAAEESVRYFRLDPEQESAVEKEVVKLERRSEPEKKLEVARREDVEFRSIEPGIEVLIEQPRAAMELPETQWGNATIERRPVPWGWFVLLGLLLVGVAAWSLTQVRDADDQLQVIRLETETILDEHEESTTRARVLVTAIEDRIREFCEAPDISSMAAMVRHPERVRPLMEEHYSRHPFQPLGRPAIELLQPLTLDLRADFWLATVSLPSGKSWNLLLETDEKAGVLVDWETSVCYQPMDWDEYVTSRPAGTTMDFRVYVEPDMFFSHEFADSNQWACYRLTALGAEEPLFGYARKGGNTAEQLRQRFSTHGPQATAMVLRLSLPTGLTSRRGVVIDRVLSERWIYVEPPNGGS